MKLNSKIKKESRLARFPYSLALKSLFAGALIFTGMQMPLQAQETPVVKYTMPSWWFGVAGGANFNFYQGTTQQLTTDFIVPTAFHDGKGVGFFVLPLLEFHRPESRLGFMLQAGYDSRKGKFDQVKSPCNCPEDLNTDLDYITVEPSIRIAPFKSNFYIYGGPRLAFNMNTNFTYQQGINPAYPEQVADPEVNGVFSNTNKSLISMQVGAGYDISLSADTKQTKVILSPFIAYHPYFGQNPRSTESWNMTTVRAGIALKFGRGHKVSAPEEVIVPVAVVVAPEVTFTANSPKNIQTERAVIEVFPLRNYVYFDLGSTEIPNRYVRLRKDQVKDFREDQVELTTPNNLSGSPKRQMIVYYNVLNILGDRMVKNPTTTIILVGSSEKGPKDGRLLAESTKFYLVDVFGIEASRIKTEGRSKPKLREEQQGGKLDLVLLREGDRRVSIESNDPGLLMEFRSGPDAPLKPITIIPAQEAPVASYVTFSNEGAENAFTSWSLVIEDEKGVAQNFGPYTKESVSLPGKSILGTRPEGDYKVTMTGKLKNGETLKKETKIHMVLWKPSTTEEVMRFSIIYDFNNSKAITIYDQYLTNVVTPKIPVNGTVSIQGHTDIIGGEDNNLKLSLARANDTREIIEQALAKAGRTDVKFEVVGYGEDEKLAPYANQFPEERSYNRSVIIDITAAK
jgi:outer membrane protein OmpA-like peptidoglycan-associated protein